MNVNDINEQFEQRFPNTQRRKRCHGNRRNQRFRKRCRARKMKPATIMKLLEKQNRIETNKNSMETTTTVATVLSTGTYSPWNQITTNSYKRKRDMSSQDLRTNNNVMIKSTSSTSIKQPSAKKEKNKTKPTSVRLETVNNNTINKSYRRPMYLKQSSSLLFQMLSNILKYPLKREDEQTFIYNRLELFDQKYCLEVELQLWQSYLDIALQHQMWPDRIYTMALTNDLALCRQYVLKYIQDIKNQLNQCQLELTKQYSRSCAITTLSLDRIDHCLQETVEHERQFLSTRNNNQLLKFKADIHKKELFKIISTYRLNIDLNGSIHRLMTIRKQQAEIWEESLMLETRVLCKILPQTFDDLEHFIDPNIYSSTIDDSTSIYLKNQRHKIIQETKRRYLNISLDIYELKIQENQQQYQFELAHLMNSMTVNNRLVAYKQIEEYMNYETEKLRNDIYKKMTSFQRKLLRQRQRSSTTKNAIGVSPEPYLDLISNPFNTFEWDHLSFGPSCIRSNQSAIRPRKQQEIELKNEHKDISTKVQNHLVEHHYIPRTLSILKDYSNHLYHYLNDCYFTPLSYKDQIQALKQIQTLASIRCKIKQHKLIIRLTDKSNNFYIGSTTEFAHKVQKFFSDTNAFMELSYNPFNEILDNVIRLLNQLASKKLILQWQCKQMMPDRSKCELAHLYFNPKTHKDGIPVRPIENTIRSSTRNISKFLDHIIRPIFDKECRPTIIVDGASLIEELQKYIKKGLLRSSTLFCTFDIRNLYTMLPQDEALDILLEFLKVHGYIKVKGIDLGTIRQLASIVLKENVFVYEKKIYKQMIGGAMGSSFTLTLANIFMWKWQKELVRRQDMCGEFYGRYIDDIFMTWNKSEKELIKLLEEVNRWHRNIKLDYKISQCLPFLDILLTNDHGILSTSVYHKPAAEPYVVPFISDHPPHVFKNVIQTALSRATRYSSTYQAYQREQRHIKLTLLYNGYPPSFIEKEFNTFYHQYTLTSPFVSSIANENEYYLLRKKITCQPTARQSRVAMNTATLDNEHNQNFQNYIQSKETTNTIEQQSKSKKNSLIIHYTHEKRFQSFKRDMHKIYQSTFKNTPLTEVRMIVGNKNRPDGENELIRKKPKPSILKNRPTTNVSRQKPHTTTNHKNTINQ